MADNENPNPELPEEQFEYVNIEEEMKRDYIDYSMSVIIGRALPDARDGLKPVNRRILFAMQQGGWVHSRPFVKCARVVGDVMGKYHPHGDSAVYDTLVRMAQDFSMRDPLIDKQGNFGSIDGDPAAAYRYTECRLKRLAEEMLADIDKQTVTMRPNFDEKLMEPTVLPARLPNLLINGSTGIAVGMATNIPPHNLNEIIDGTIHLIDHPDADTRALMQFVKGPDFPTGALIRGAGQIYRMYETGRGLIRIRSKTHITEDAKGRERIIVNEIPYMVNKANLIMKIAQLVNEKKIDGISDVRDESDQDGIRVVIEIKRNAMAKVVLNNLYKQTSMENTFGAIMLAIDKGRPKVMSLKQLLQCFIDHRFEVITRRTEFELAKAKARAHILEGLLIAIDNMDDVVKIIRDSKNRDEARERLIERFKLSELQANAILDMRLYQLTGLEREKLEAEYKEVMARIEHLEGLLGDPGKIYHVIKEDLRSVQKTYGSERRTELTADDSEINIEDLIEDRPCVITVSHAGYIKRVPLETYREQRRGGKGVVGMTTREDDFVENIYSVSTHDYILVFTQNGRVYWKKVYEVPESSRTGRGKAIINLIDFKPGEKVATMIRVREFSEDQHLVFATRNGVVKKTHLAAFKNPRADGIWAINIDEDDELIDIKMTSGDDSVILVTRQGKSVRFHETRLRNQGRNTRGVRGVTLGPKNDAVVGVAVVAPSGYLMVMCEKGYGKRTEMGEFPEKNRGGKGVIAIITSERNGPVVSAHTVFDGDAMMLITQEGQMIRMGVADIRSLGRNTQGVRLVSLRADDKLIGTARIAEEEAEIADAKIEQKDASDKAMADAEAAFKANEAGDMEAGPDTAEEDDAAEEDAGPDAAEEDAGREGK
jgi:DNA gyrase subunit A